MPNPIAIDFGCQYCSIASINAEGVPTLVQDRHDRNSFLTPLAIAVSADQLAIGDEARQLWNDDPSIELLTGFFEGLGTGSQISTQSHAFSAESLCAFIANKLKKDSENSWAGPMDTVVLSVSNVFNSRQRRGLVRAFRLAGIEQYEIIDSMLAASFFLQPEPSEKPILICDIRDSYIHAALIHSTTTERKVIATCMDYSMGSSAISDAIASQLSRQIDLNPLVPSTQASLRHSLVNIADSIKNAFSSSEVTHVSEKRFVLGMPIEIAIERSQFLAWCVPLFQAVSECIAKCIGSANIGWDELNALRIVGELTVPETVQGISIRNKACPKELIGIHQPIFSHVYGASMYAERRLKNTPAPALRPRAIHGIGIRTRNRQTDQLVVNPIVPNNALLPSQWSCILKTSRIDQERIVIELVQTSHNNADSICLGTFEFGPLEPQSERHPIEITVIQDAQGMVDVLARDGLTGKSIRQLQSGSPTKEAIGQRNADREEYAWGNARFR